MIDIADVKTLTLQSGQTLVVQTERLLPSHLTERLRNEFQGLFPNNQILIIDKSLQLMVIEE